MPGSQIHIEVNGISLLGLGGEISSRHYRPASGVAAPFLVFYYGGGWILGDLDIHDALCRLTCHDADIHVLSIDYRLAPEYPALAGIEDTLSRRTSNATELGASSGSVAVSWDSAGSNRATICVYVPIGPRRRRPYLGVAVAALPAD
ncbi:alpha/beta hydrolase fold domain-containing protein [Mycobacterium lepromatosis]|uniref:alpha/beta hydrolase fold domain-containing protein n=1 Tax=Mycobacterium lepromatosis TaxID=480418 RepID=UPI002351EFD3|nr:alpha/beta hydrolase fold domain-containing protein [Mycobacterium lepromatosis]